MTKGWNKKPDPGSRRTAARAAGLALARGCETWNDCWEECVDAAKNTILKGGDRD